jgi:hypothetical protein
MSDNKIIDITEIIKKKKEKQAAEARNQLNIAIDDLDIDIDKIINTFVFFDPANYYLNNEDSMTTDMIIGSLQCASSLLIENDMQQIADDVEKIILKISNLLGENNED